MAGQPVMNPMSQQLGPAPRMGVQAPAGGSGLEFFTPPTGTMGGPSQPGSFPSSQPQSQPFQSQAPSGNFGQPQPSFGGQMGGPVGGQRQAGFFPQSTSMPSSYDDDFENEPPLLEELGINVEHIILRMQGVAFFKKLDEDILRDADLSGPLLICLTLGMSLLLAGKLQFGYIYGLAAGGSFGICMLINVMSQKGGIDLYKTMSILGYGMIPIVFLSILGIFISLKSTFGIVAASLCVGWATATSSRFFATAIAMDQQRWLVAYPVGLVYTFFTLITIF